VARFYLQHVFKNYSLPRKIISDHDTRFTGKFMRKLCRILGIQQNMSTAYHPRTDGQSERSNQWVEQFFRFYIDEDQKNWVFYLPLAKFVHNSWRNESTGQTLFEVLMGYSPRAEWTTVPSPIPQVTLRLDQFKKAREQAQRLMKKAQQGWEKHK
jgi:transposase InsO family protein